MKSFFVALLALAAVTGQSAPIQTVGDMKYPIGLKRPADWAEKTTWVDATAMVIDGGSPTAVPEKFDWRDCATLPPVNRQLNNDCWAQGSAGVVELLAHLVGEDFNQRASVQSVIDCSNAGTAANGGYWAFGFMKTMRLPFLSEYPYDGRDHRCKNLQGKWKVARWGNIGQRGRGPTPEELKMAILQYGPLGTTIYANDALGNFRGGDVFRACGNGRTNHITVITGYEQVNGTLVLHNRNSWGVNHGAAGYAKIPYDCSSIGSEDVAFAVLAKAI